MKETLCWDCEKALGYCPWSEKFEPVPGWNATPTKIPVYQEDRFVDSYLVHDCPMFVPDAPGKRILGESLRKMIKVSERTFREMSDHRLIGLVKELGYNLYIRRPGINRYFYIEKIKPKEF